MVEEIAEIMAEQWKVPREKSQSFGKWGQELGGRLDARWPEQKEQLGLLMGILRATRSWTSTYNHFNAEIPQREQARFVLHLMANLIGIAGQILSALSNPLEKAEKP